MGSCSGKQVLKVSQSVIEVLHSLLSTDSADDFAMAKKLILELADGDKLGKYSPAERAEIYALLAKLIKNEK